MLLTLHENFGIPHREQLNLEVTYYSYVSFFILHILLLLFYRPIYLITEHLMHGKNLPCLTGHNVSTCHANARLVALVDGHFQDDKIKMLNL